MGPGAAGWWQRRWLAEIIALAEGCPDRSGVRSLNFRFDAFSEQDGTCAFGGFVGNVEDLPYRRVRGRLSNCLVELDEVGGEDGHEGKGAHVGPYVVNCNGGAVGSLRDDALQQRLW